VEAENQSFMGSADGLTRAYRALVLIIMNNPMASDAPVADAVALLPVDVRWEKAYSGLPVTVSQVRRDVRAVLGACPEVVVDHVEVVVSELANNAITHSRSGTDGGTYTVRISHQATEKVPYVWVEVYDQGSQSWDGIMRPEPTHGLALIEHFSTWMGSEDGPEGERVVYARLEYRADGTPLYGIARVPELPPNLAGIRDSGEITQAHVIPATEPKEGAHP
jgi:hypothetical protein